uniref:NHS like 3 n=1 Tax=Poecilia formosa TaxID=48698 RepID=A0A096LW63_POEFO
MSRRRSTGDLVPRDISEILAKEARAQRGQKKSGVSLGQAFSWLRKSRRKKNLGNGVSRNPTGVADNKPGLLNHDAAKAGPKGNEDQKRLTVHYTASQHYQENVFIEASRPQYLEDLHTEAQEGLKILQQEEDKNGVNFADDESIIEVSLRSFKHVRQLSYISQLTSVDSSEALYEYFENLKYSLGQQKGSTFKPLNPVKRFDRSRKRNRRTTIMGIPNQVQKELVVSTQLPNHENHNGDSQSSVVIIPTVDGGTPLAKKEGARVHLSELELMLEQVFRDEQVARKHLKGGYQDEQAHLCSTVRPKSLAFPGMTTSFSLSPSMLHFLQEPQGPVMSISPQATYLSTIIPNAVLPASVEVIEIDRSSSRTRGSSVNHGNGACAVSKSSLTSEESAVSPLLSRRSASGSNWSESQSSKTIISDSSVSSSNRGGFNVQESQTQESSSGQDLTSFCSPVNANNGLNKTEVNTTEAESGHGATQSLTAGDQAKNKRNCIHSLSVTKTKQPPAPPRRTNSLHGKKVKKPLSNSTGPSSTNSSSTLLTPLQDSPNQAEEATASQQESDPSSPQKTAPDGGKFERTLSPSSGYSSQSGTPTLSPKEISPNSPDKLKKKPIKPERSASRASSSAASPSSSLTSLSSGTSEPANADVTTCSTTLSPQGDVQELFNIPTPPKVKAPRPPPPETWAHSRRTVELLCGAPNVIKTPLKVPADKSNMEKSEVQPMQTLTVEVPKMSKLSPPPTPPPAYQPTPPPIRKPAASLVSPMPSESEKEHDVSHVVDSCWPPPPPPLEGEPIFDGGDEVDFPLPPPPSIRVESPMPVQEVSPSSSYLKRNSLKLEDQSPSTLPVSPELSAPTSVPKAPPPPMQPSGTYRDARNKELLSRHKSAPIPKEDANIPLVTPSLLQMVRLRTVSMTEGQGPQDIPPKPIRKSLSVKSPPQTVKSSTVTMGSPSLRLQEAIRMKTAAMSSRHCLPHRLACDILKSPASTASFIFSRSTKKVVIEPVAAASSEAQASLKQSLAAELRQVSDQSKAGVLSNGRVKTDRIPPPIAKKPTPGSTSPLLNSHT